jgi:two-component system cell cycle sensor histidine kinase/response regulator CckA
MIVFPSWIKISLVLALLALVVGGAWFYRIQEQTMRHEAEQNLTAIARLKADQIAAWRKGQLSEAAALQESVFLIQSVDRFSTDPSSMHAEDLRTRLLILAKQNNYTDILMVNPEGKQLLSLSGDLYHHSGYASVLPTALHKGTPAFIDLHNEPQDPAPHISVVAPLFAGPETAQKPIGALILVSDASQFLYPLIQSWPTPSKTAETLIVRRDGDDVLFLNDLRHQADTALKLRMPLSRTDLPASMAVLGQKGVVMGKDYRGVEVVAAILPIPDSPWFMLAKVDAAEVFADWRFRSALIVALILGLMSFVGAAGLILWQREKKSHYRALYLSEAAFRISAQRHSVTLKSIGDAVIATDARGMVELLNPVAETLTGWTAAEARGKPLETIFRIVNEDTGQKVEDPVAKVLCEGTVVGLANHTLLIARDGTRRPIADSGAPIRDQKNEITGVVLVFRDQSEERWSKQMTQARSNLIEYAATHTLEELLTKALDEIAGLVESPIGFYHFVQDDQRTLSLQQWSSRTLTEFCRAQGKGRHYPIEQAGVWADCARQKKPIIHNDYASLKHKQGLPEGHAKVMRELVIPVMRKDKVVAILGVGNKPVDYTEKDVETVSLLSDVTWEIVARKRNEVALQTSENRYRRLFESAKDGILILEADTGKIVDVNPFLSQLLGISHKICMGKYLWEIGPFKNFAASKDAFQNLKDKKYIRYDDLPLETSDGRIVEVEFVSNVYSVDHTNVIQCNIRDISERKQAEAERERLLSAIEQAGEMIVITDPEGTIQYVNPAFERVTGYARKEATGKSPRILKSGKQDDPFYQNLWATISGGGTFQGRMVNKRKDGTLFTEQASIAPVHDASGRIVNYVAVKHDITEQLKLAVQLQQAQKMESVGRLAGGVAHDFNNMLSVILGYAELALDKVAPSEPLHADLNEILIAARRSIEITRQLLAFARKQTIAPKVLDLNANVESMLKMLRRLMGEDIDLAWRPQNNLWKIKIDPSQLEQILVNLCVNARDAIGDVGKITIETHRMTFDKAYCTDHAGFVPGEFVLLAVSDDGCGMDKETLDNIFEPFFTTKDVSRGTGLGLATIYGVVKQNNGFINVYSEPGKGSTFKIYLPRHEGKTEPEQTEIVTKVPTSSGEVVLLVEDEPAIRKMGKMMLERLGYEVLATDAPDEALRLAAEHPGGIHLLVTDVIMPGMNGRDLADQMHTLYPDIKTLFMSGYTADVIAHRGVLEEGVQFIHKPFSKKDLAVKVREILDRVGH